jgi:micrococcal nuclease
MRRYRFLVFAALALAGCGGATASTVRTPQARLSQSPRHAIVAYAVDGDTLRVRLASGELAYVRLVGIDTPEDVRPGYPTECGARAAAASMRRLAPEGARVLLRSDSVADATDRYGRILAHAFVGRRQLEVVQLRRGWAYVYRYQGQRFDGLPRFRRASRSARRAHRGVWGRCNGDFHSAEAGVQN